MQALVEAYLRYADDLLRYCHRQMADAAVAEDLVQDTFLRAFEYLQDGKKIEQMKTFLYKVASNLVIDEWRRRGRAPPNVSLDALVEQGFDPGHETVHHTHDQLDVSSALQGVSQDEHKLLSMRYIDGLAVSDIASSMQMAPNAVAVRLHRATKRVAKHILFRQQWHSPVSSKQNHKRESS